MSALSFHSPYLLAGAALLVGLWAAWYLPKLFGSRGDGRSAFRFPSVSPFKEIGGGQAVLPFKLLKAARLAVLILLAIALGRPQSGKEHTKISTEGIDIILAVDTSGSMEALDLDTDQPLAQRRNRLEIVKDVVQDFVEARPNDQMGLVVFGSEAYTQCPMTLDHGILSGFLDRLEIGMAGDGTALGNAIGRAVKRLKDSDAKSKVVVLLTDGRSNAGKLSPLKAAEVAQSLGIKIYTVGAGARGQAPFLRQGLFGMQPVYQDVDIDEETLTQIAKLTKGSYFRAEDVEGLRDVYKEIDALERTEIESLGYLEYNEHFYWFLIPAILLLFLERLLLLTRFRRVPL